MVVVRFLVINLVVKLDLRIVRVFVLFFIRVSNFFFIYVDDRMYILLMIKLIMININEFCIR